MSQGMDGSSILVSIIEDSLIHVEWLKQELMEDKKFKIVSIDNFGRQGVESVKTKKPDLVLLDFQLKDMTALQISKRLKIYTPKIKIFIMTAHTEISILERLINDKNIDGIAIKGSSYFEENILNILTNIYNDISYLDPSLLRKMRELRYKNKLSDLTPKEFEVFIQVNIGKTDEQIAKDLSVEVFYIKNLKSRISKKIKGDKIDDFLKKLSININPDGR